MKILDREQVWPVLKIIAVILFVWFLAFIFYDPMRMPAPIIRFHILRHTPMGVHIDEAISIIENNERWGRPSVNRNNGFLHPSRFVDESDGSSTRAVVGNQSVRTHPERYNVPLWHERSTRILWGFDEDGKLIYVYSFFTPQLR